MRTEWNPWTGWTAEASGPVRHPSAVVTCAVHHPEHGVQQAAAALRARLAAARKLAAQRRIDARDALANRYVGKSELVKSATGSVGGRGKPLPPAKSVQATPNVLGNLAAVEASWAGGGSGPGAAAWWWCYRR